MKQDISLETIIKAMIAFILLNVLLHSCATPKPQLVEVTETHLVLKKPNGKLIKVKRESNPYLRGFKQNK